MYSLPARSASGRSHTSRSSLASSVAAGPREELQHWLLVAKREVELPVVDVVEVDVLDVMPSRRTRHRLEGAELDASDDVSVGDLGHPSAPVALPHAVLTGMGWRQEVGGATDLQRGPPRLRLALWMGGGEKGRKDPAISGVDAVPMGDFAAGGADVVGGGGDGESCCHKSLIHSPLSRFKVSARGRFSR
jgi:hypothetical protein